MQSVQRTCMTLRKALKNPWPGVYDTVLPHTENADVDDPMLLDILSQWMDRRS